MRLPVGYDLRTIVTVAVVLPIVTFTAIGAARLFGRIFRWWWNFTANAIVGVVVEALTKVVTSRLDRLENKLDVLTDDNSRAHSEVTGRLDAHDRRFDEVDGQLASINERLERLEKQRTVRSGD